MADEYNMRERIGLQSRMVCQTAYQRVCDVIRLIHGLWLLRLLPHPPLFPLGRNGPGNAGHLGPSARRTVYPRGPVWRVPVVLCLSGAGGQ